MFVRLSQSVCSLIAIFFLGGGEGGEGLEARRSKSLKKLEENLKNLEKIWVFIQRNAHLESGKDI